MVLDSICALWSKAHIVPINGNTQAHYSACANDDVASHEHFCVWGGGGAGGAYTCRGPANALCAKSKSGYMDGELYLLWFEKVVLKNCSLDKPVILIQDGHKSHMTLSIVETVHRGMSFSSTSLLAEHMQPSHWTRVCSRHLKLHLVLLSSQSHLLDKIMFY